MIGFILVVSCFVLITWFCFPGALGAGSFILAAGYAETAMVAVTCMCIGVAASGLMHSGYNVNMLDIAPRYACVIMGLTNTVGTLTGFLSPMMVGFITANKVSSVETRSAWSCTGNDKQLM